MPTVSQRIKLGWAVLLLAIFAIFSVWYGGNGKPLSVEEGTRMLAELRAIHNGTSPSEGDLVTNLTDMLAHDDGKEFYAVNLEQLKSGDEAEAADRAYGKIVLPLLFKRAGHPVFISNRTGLMLGDYGRNVDRVAVVRYRSLRDLIKMASEPAMIEGGVHKFASLAHTEVFITRPFISFVQVRLVIGLILTLLGLGGLKLIDRFTAR